MKGILKILLFTSLFISFSIYGCSSSEDACEDHHFDNIQLASNSHMDLDDYIHWNHGRKSLTFYDDDTFDDHVQWKVVLEDGKIEKLYKDGRRLSKSEIEDNEDYIYDKLEEIEESMRDLRVDLEELEANLSDMEFDFDFDFDFEFDDENFHLDINFDEEDFAESMEQLSKSLSKLKRNKYKYHYEDDWDWDDEDSHWNSKEFKKEMKKMKKELRSLEDIEIDIDMDEFNESMGELSESLKDMKINMSGFDDEMLNLKIELKGLKKEMKKLKGFLDEMSTELEWDGYIDDADDDFELELSEDEMIVNGTKLPDRLHRKYLEMYEEHFGKELEDRFTMHR
jgi:hypothetical protein